MYICICNGTTDKQIIDCSENVCTFKELIDNLKCCQQCGICSSSVKEIYETYKKEKTKK